MTRLKMNYLCIQMYKVLDLHDLERTFSAYQRQQETMSSPSTYSSEVMVKGTPKQKELSLVDGRRAQNCTILLSKLKMTSQSLAHAVLTMDTEEELPKDMCEQVSVLTTPGDRPLFYIFNLYPRIDHHFMCFICTQG